jgi:autotransporter-associated beta strand protein
MAEFKLDTGTLNANDLIAGSRGGSTVTTATGTGIVTISGGTVTFNSSTGPIQLGVNSATSGTGAGTLNISGGSVSVAANAGNSIRLGNATAAGGTANGTLNLTGGTLTVAGDIIRGATTGTAIATLKLSGGTLDMSGNDIGAAGAGAVALIAESGTLKNVASINGTGGLTKTTAGTLVLQGTNNYTGDTTVSGGTLTVNGSSIANASKLILDGGKIDVGAGITETVGSLFFGTTQQVTGTWGSSLSSASRKDDTRFSGSGVLNVIGGPAGMPAFQPNGVIQPKSFAEWMSGFPTINPDEGGASEDPDHDGIPNALELVVGGRPDGSSADCSLGLTASLIMIDPDGDGPAAYGTYLRYTHRRSQASVNAGITTTCEFATDPAGIWFAASTTPAVVKVVTPGPTAPAAYDTVDYYLPTTAAKDGRWFGRLRAVVP